MCSDEGLLLLANMTRGMVKAMINLLLVYLPQVAGDLKNPLFSFFFLFYISLNIIRFS